MTSLLVRLLAVLLPVLLLPLAGALPASAAEPAVVRADLVVEVQPLAPVVTAVVLEYSDVLDLDGATIPASAFSVTATLRGAGEPLVRERTVTRVYTNDRAERAESGRSGRYLVLELQAPEPGSEIMYFTFPAFVNILYPLEGAYAVRQNAPVVGASGQVVLPEPSTPVTTTGVLIPVADEFSRESLTASNGRTVAYRLFSPQAYRQQPDSERRYPLVVTLHGAGERGSDNLLPIVGNQLAYAFAEPGSQSRNPAFVLSPQAPVAPLAGGTGWTDADLQQAVLEAVEQAVRTHPIDPDRIYLSGVSMGSIGSWNLLPKNPYTFAGALLVTGQGDPAQMSRLTHLPIWATHSRDDAVVRYDTPVSDRALVDALEAAGATVVHGEWPGNLPEPEAEARARELVARARAVGSHTLFTTYTTGTTPVNAHWSWVPTYLNDVMVDWLFSNVRTSFTSVPARLDELLASGRLSGTAADAVLDRLTRARGAAQVGREAVAMAYLDQAIARARNQIKGDADDLAVRAEVVELLETLRAEQQLRDDRESAEPGVA